MSAQDPGGEKRSLQREVGGGRGRVDAPFLGSCLVGSSASP